MVISVYYQHCNLGFWTNFWKRTKFLRKIWNRNFEKKNLFFNFQVSLHTHTHISTQNKTHTQPQSFPPDGSTHTPRCDISLHSKSPQPKDFQETESIEKIQWAPNSNHNRLLEMLGEHNICHRFFSGRNLNYRLRRWFDNGILFVLGFPLVWRPLEFFLLFRFLWNF